MPPGRHFLRRVGAGPRSSPHASQHRHHARADDRPRTTLSARTPRRGATGTWQGSPTVRSPATHCQTAPPPRGMQAVLLTPAPPPAEQLAVLDLGLIEGSMGGPWSGEKVARAAEPAANRLSARSRRGWCCEPTADASRSGRGDLGTRHNGNGPAGRRPGHRRRSPAPGTPRGGSSAASRCGSRRVHRGRLRRRDP